ncbi:MAG: UDP-N-acetylmuramate:L-alanyl-gamma-D-glutamyl-meso-diaminopimelate ligase [Candidatus Electrothrix aestuarii]|uniref:UDP-N-acetylmuramate--L-alanine ligase n=1 Tax=Candidatus Electrothrix aestuarii TaxID=3062594 RepID=A0AAU8LQZ0_9BACT|nr:UDP-N-acetylmuramate:L-alanyl-gamma-D-glutamyl-meso-diaminopimelate ligase [Candidatus Electrothrix aestuarii]
MKAQLDPQLNIAPEHIEHIHIMGVCGTGMAAIAGMLKERGYKVTGSDQNVYPPMSDFLAQAGIEVMQGYVPENLEPRPDLVIVGNVIQAVFPEAQRLAELGIPYLSMPQALGHFFLGGEAPKKSLVVAGTHGKTTTSSLLATALHRADCSPGFLIGGIVEAFARNYNLGDGEYFVVEGDEYDTAFFNKVSKFLHYRPHCAILTSIEFDHADIFADLEAIKASFARFVGLIPADGALVACMDDPVVAEIAAQCAAPVISYGTGEHCRWQLRDLTVTGLSSSFAAYKDGTLFGEFTLPMSGRHNGLNALAVIALMDHLGISRDAIRQGLASFEGIKRRQQIRGEVNGITVIDDFAHHPTAVRETVQALRLAWPDRRLLIVFEPRTNSSRRAVFQQQYEQAFSGADQVLVREIVPLSNVPAEEQFSSRRLAVALHAQGVPAEYFPDTAEILTALAEQVRPGDVVAILSNGGFDNIHEQLLGLLQNKEGCSEG